MRKRQKKRGDSQPPEKAPAQVITGEEDNDQDIEDDFEDIPSPVGQSFLQRFWNNMSYFKYVIIILILPPILNFGALQRESSALIPEGERVYVGWGQKMYIHCEGEGLPTVILDAPTGLSSDIWIFLHKELAQFTKVCVYDRSGIGNSDAIFSEVSSDDISSSSRQYIAQPSSLDQMMSDLHYLVHDGKPLLRPFIMVGSEVGALVSRLYALINPDDVTSLVLIDPLVETLLRDGTEWKDYWYSKVLPSYQSLHLSAMLGLSRIALLVGWFKPFYFQENVPEDAILRQKSLLCNPRHINSVFNEHLYMNMSFHQISSVWMFEPFPSNISVSVITRKYPQEFPSHLHKEWNDAQKYLVEKLHPGCQSTVIDNTDFLELYSKPDHVVSVVKSEVKKWRENLVKLPEKSE